MGKFEKGDVVLLKKTIEPLQEKQRLEPYRTHFLMVETVSKVDGDDVTYILKVAKTGETISVNENNITLFHKHVGKHEEDIDQSNHENLYFG